MFATHWPDVTVYVDAPEGVRLRRIEARSRPLLEANPHQVSAADIRVFAQRDDVARRLIAEERHRFYVLDNGNRALEEGTNEVVGMIRQRLDQSASDGVS